MGGNTQLEFKAIYIIVYVHDHQTYLIPRHSYPNFGLHAICRNRQKAQVNQVTCAVADPGF